MVIFLLSGILPFFDIEQFLLITHHTQGANRQIDNSVN